MVEIFRTWAIKDADGNTLNEFDGEVDRSLIGTEWNGKRIASVEQLVDIRILSEEEREFENLKTQVTNLTARVSALEGNRGGPGG